MVLAPPAEPSTAPPPVAGPFGGADGHQDRDLYDPAGDAEPETVTISPKAETVQVALTWPNSGSSFDGPASR